MTVYLEVTFASGERVFVTGVEYAGFSLLQLLEVRRVRLVDGRAGR